MKMSNPLKWTCRHCTYANSNVFQECEICGKSNKKQKFDKTFENDKDIIEILDTPEPKELKLTRVSSKQQKNKVMNPMIIDLSEDNGITRYASMQSSRSKKKKRGSTPPDYSSSGNSKITHIVRTIGSDKCSISNPKKRRINDSRQTQLSFISNKTLTINAKFTNEKKQITSLNKEKKLDKMASTNNKNIQPHIKCEISIEKKATTTSKSKNDIFSAIVENIQKTNIDHYPDSNTIPYKEKEYSNPLSENGSEKQTELESPVPIQPKESNNYNDLYNKAIEVMKSVFRIQRLRNLQPQAIEYALKGQSQIVIMATGGGKSLCYQLPAGIVIVFKIYTFISNSLAGAAFSNCS